MKFHEGEKAVQERMGVRTMAERVRESIHPGLPATTHKWLGAQRLAAATTIAPGEAIWISALTGAAGFIQPADDASLRIRPDRLDETMRANLAESGPCGLIVLSPASRQRLRINGVARLEGDALILEPQQSYANCPKYIQARHISRTEAAVEPTLQVGTALTAEHRTAVESADTFFIGSAYESSADASHRGGNPGFVRAVNETCLEWQDYPGNTMFNTFGNLEKNPRCGLLFIDWDRGNTLQLSGEATLNWEGPDITVRFHLREWRETRQASPQRWELDEYSRFNPAV